MKAITEHGEPPGLWLGDGAPDLGLSGEVDEAVMGAVYGDLVDPRTGEALGSRPREYTPVEDRVAEALAREPDATAERRAALERDVRKTQKSTVKYYDLTFSAPKSWSLYHASLQLAGRHEEAAQVWAAWMDGVRAGLDLMQAEAGYARAGHHGKAVEGRTSGRYVDGHGWVVAAFRQHTSRDEDPQLHVHAAVLNRVRTVDVDPATGAERVVWRALDGKGIYRWRAAAGALSERVAEESLTHRLGARVAMRPDGKAREILGISPAVRDQFSTRRRTIVAGVAQLAAAYEEKHGHAPGAYELARMSEYITLDSRQRKHQHAPSREELLTRWETAAAEQVREQLREVPAAVARASAEAGVERLGFDPQQVIGRAVAELQDARATWSRSDLMAAIIRRLPDCLGGLEPRQVVALAEELTTTATTPGGPHGVLRLDAPDVVPVPAELLRADGLSIYTPHGAEIYTTEQALAREERLIAAGRTDGAPTVAAEVVEATIEGTTLTGPQAEAVRGIAGSGRRVDVLIGPAGTGKSHTIAALTAVWEASGGRVIGIATSQRAADVLAEEGVATVANAAALLAAQDRLPELGERLQRLREREEGLVARFADAARRLEEQDEHGRTFYSGRNARNRPEGFDRWRATLATRVERAAEAVERVRANIARTAEEVERYTLRPGQLVIVDEAGMSATPQLAQVQELVEDVGAKMLLAGDHGQLAAVGAGGALKLLANDLDHVYELPVVMRFAAGWERDASLRLRAGDTSVLGEYARQGRLRAGTGEEMTARAYAGWLADHLSGRSSLLIAATNEQAADLSARARGDLVRYGRVEPGGVRLHDGNTAGVGDLVQLRQNDRTIRTGDGAHWATNRDVVTVVGRSADGTLTVAYPDGARMVLPAGYVAERAELAYAGTVHAAQGRTVDTTHAVVDATTSRELLYVALTRGRLANYGYVVTDPRVSELEPEGATPASDMYAVLAAALDRVQAEASAVEVMRNELDRADHLGVLEPIWADVIAADAARRYGGVLRRALGEDTYNRVAAADSYGPLVRLLRSADERGLDSAAVLARAVGRRELATAEDVGAVLHWRVERILDRAPAPAEAPASYVERTPDIPGPVGVYAREVAAAMDRRVERLGERLADRPEAWTVERLGWAPRDPLARAEWQERAAVVAAYREAHGYAAVADAIGAAPPRGAAEAHAAWQRAYAAIGSPADQLDTAAATDTELAMVVDRYAREEQWAPPYVAEDLQAARLAAEDARVQAEHLHAEADAADPQARPDLLARAAAHEHLHGLQQRRIDQLTPIDQARTAWHQETEPARQAAAQARVELERRARTPEDAVRVVEDARAEIVNEIRGRLDEMREQTAADHQRRAEGRGRGRRRADPGEEPTPEQARRDQQRQQEMIDRMRRMNPPEHGGPTIGR